MIWQSCSRMWKIRDMHPALSIETLACPEPWRKKIAHPKHAVSFSKLQATHKTLCTSMRPPLILALLCVELHIEEMQMLMMAAHASLIGSRPRYGSLDNSTDLQNGKVNRRQQEGAYSLTGASKKMSVSLVSSSSSNALISCS